MTFAIVGTSGAAQTTRQDEREPELPELEAEERLASVSGLRLSPSRDEQTEDRDQEQDGGHGSKIDTARRSLHP